MRQSLLYLEITSYVEVDHVLRKARVGTERLELISTVHCEPRRQLLHNLKPVNPTICPRESGVAIAALESGHPNEARIVEQLKFKTSPDKIVIKVRAIDEARVCSYNPITPGILSIAGNIETFSNLILHEIAVVGRD